MAKADRLERLDTRRVELEAEYRDTLVAALQRTAAGSWGLFDHQADRRTREKIAPVVESLSDLAEEIDAMRDQLGLEEFALHQEFVASRGPVPSSAVGEPKQARVWLDKLLPFQGRGIAYGLERLLEWDSWFAFTVGGSRWMGFRHILGKLAIRVRAMHGIIFSN